MYIVCPHILHMYIYMYNNLLRPETLKNLNVFIVMLAFLCTTAKMYTQAKRAYVR